ADKLYAAMQDYAANVVGTAIVYDPNSYPYFFSDDNGNGEVDGEEGSYAAWTPRLLKAAYNYQYVQKDPGAFAHNGKYVIQFLYDNLNSLAQVVDVDMAGMVRPEAPAE
ncbi:MAG: polyheme membrane-associated cytochrome C, partial [Anaerolineae bacterium]